MILQDVWGSRAGKGCAKIYLSMAFVGAGIWDAGRRNVKSIEAKVRSGKHLFAVGGGTTRAMTLPIDNDTSRKRGKMKSCRCDADVGYPQ